MWQSFAAIGRETTEISRWIKQESRAVARKPRDAAAVLNFADNIYYNFKNSQASKATSLKVHIPLRCAYCLELST